MAGSKGFPRLVAYIKRLYLSSNNRKGALQEVFSTDCELFVSVGEDLKDDAFKWVAGDVEGVHIGIVRPQRGGTQRVLAEFVASTPLMPLLKPDNGISPIIVGSIWRRLASKVAMRGVRKEMSKYLEDFQFGVGVPSGAEAVSPCSKRILKYVFHWMGHWHMLTVISLIPSPGGFGTTSHT
ncbi:hypothetical protein Tco_1137915 [Tanacetum coccineum]